MALETGGVHGRQEGQDRDRGRGHPPGLIPPTAVRPASRTASRPASTRALRLFLARGGAVGPYPFGVPSGEPSRSPGYERVITVGFVPGLSPIDAPNVKGSRLIRGRCAGEGTWARMSRRSRSRARTASDYRQKVRRCLDVFALMLDDFGVRRRPARRPGWRSSSTWSTRDAEPAMRNAEILANLADPTFQTELGQFNLELNARPRLIAGDRLRRLRARHPGAAWRAPSDRAAKADAHDRADRHPAHPHPGDTGAGQPVHQRAVPRAQRADRRRPRRGHRPRHPRRRAAAHAHRLDRARGRLHQRAVPPAGGAGHVRRTTGTPPRRSPAMQVAVGANSPYLLRPPALGRDPHRAVRAGHRHPAGRAQGPGGTPARLVRRALDHLDLRPVRGERAVLPAAAADLRRRGPGGGAARRRRAAARRAAPAQRHRLPLEPAGLRHHERPPAPARGEPGAAGRARPWSTCWPTPRSTSGWPAQLAEADRPIWTQLPFTAAEDELPHRRPRRHRRLGLLAAAGRGPGDRPGAATCCCPRRTPGWTGSASPRRTRDRLLGIIEERCRTGRNGAVWQTETVRNAEKRLGLDRPAALHDMLQRYIEHQRTNEPVHTWD